MAETLAAVYDTYGRTVLIPASDVTPDMDRPASAARRAPVPDSADRYRYGVGPAYSPPTAASISRCETCGALFPWCRCKGGAS
jgi:hypothetical protein